MITSNDIKEYTVCLNGGSGVIFQPMDINFSYILTALHVFEDIDTQYKGNINIHYYHKTNGSFEAYPVFEKVLGENYFPHPQKDIDIAIVKIGRIEVPDKLIISENHFSDNKDYYLSGFPKLRRDENNGVINLKTYRIDDKIDILTDTENRRIEADVRKNQNLGELKGTSGGGIFKPAGDFLLLTGIQSEVPNSVEALGRIEFTPIKEFADIIKEYPAKLESILPPYLKCFSFLKNDAFELKVDLFDEEKIEFTRSYLKNKVSDVINSGITPIAIKTFFETRLLVDEKETQALYERKIWLVWLEFLTILNIVKYRKFGGDEMAEIFNTFRLIYSNSNEDWTYLIKEELPYSDYKGLMPNSNVFIGSKVTPLNIVKLPGDKIRDIGKVYDKSRFKTDAGIHPYTHFNFYHVSYFDRVCIFDKLDKFETILNEAELCEALKTEYNELFK
jgi:hypothetical protein